MKINSNMSELLGAHVGDGTLYQTKRSIVWELRGGLNEKEYYIENITPLLNKIFDLEINSKFRSGGANGCWGVQTSNKRITGFFIDFGFNPGRKTHTVYINEYIFNSSLEVQRFFVRGLFDTDGCIRFDKINKNKLHTYPRLEFGFASLRLRDDLKKLLDLLGFRNFVWDDKNFSKLCVSGKVMLEKWFSEINPNNPKHLKKYLFWKENGFYEPFATVA